MNSIQVKTCEGLIEYANERSVEALAPVLTSSKGYLPMAKANITLYAPRSAICQFYGYTFEYVRNVLGVIDLTLKPQGDIVDFNGIAECFHLAQLAKPDFLSVCLILDILQTGYVGKNPDDLRQIYASAKSALLQPYWELDELAPKTDARTRALIEKIKAGGSIQIGYVYLIKYQLGIYKIGRSVNPDNRRVDLSISSPHILTLDCVIPTDDMSWLEAELHQRFAARCIRAEWYKLSRRDVEFIHALASGASFVEAEEISHREETPLPLFNDGGES